jgi:hypothetical protein
MKITDEQKQLIVGAVVGAVLLLVGQIAQILGAQSEISVQPTPAPVQPEALALVGGIQCKASPNPCVVGLYGRDINLYSDGGSTVKYAVDGATGSVTHGGWERWTPAAPLTVTDGAVFTPTGSYQPLGAAAPVTPTVYTATAVAGSVLLLVNTGANAITIQDTATQALAGDFSMGQYDTLLLIFDGTRWIERARSNN